MKNSGVCLNGRFSGTLQPTGTQTVAFHLFDAVLRAERDFPVVVFADAKFPGVDGWREIPETKFVQIPFSSWSRARAQLWEQFTLAREARKSGCTLVHHPINTSPRYKYGIKHLVTVHDLNFLHHPEWFGPAFRFWLMRSALPGMRGADCVAAVSDYVLNDVRSAAGVSRDKSERIYNGCKKMPAVAAAEEDPNTILAVNAWQPHKNLVRLIAAFNLLRAEQPTLKLQIAGRPQAQFRADQSLAKMLQSPGVNVLGYLLETELAKAYASARVFCYPSLEEGFGLPILEAMSAGTRVVTSNISCLPEIAGGAAILVDPVSVPSIVGGIRKVLLESPVERAQSIAKGKNVAAGFAWDKAGADYIRVYQRLLTTP